MHPAKVVVILGTKAIGNQAVSAKCVYQLHTIIIRVVYGDAFIRTAIPREKYVNTDPEESVRLFKMTVVTGIMY